MAYFNDSFHKYSINKLYTNNSGVKIKYFQEIFI